MEIQVIHLKEVDSTNLWAKANAHTFDLEKLTCIIADTQTAGRGRLGRSWESKSGNLHMTLFSVIPKNLIALQNIAQILSLSAAQVLEDLKIPVLMKWPNDILHDGEKLSGTLVETVQMGEKIGVIAGIGINVNVPVNVLETTSLFQISQKTWDLEFLRDTITKKYILNLRILLERGFIFLKPEIEKRLCFHGEIVTCHTGNQVLEGICVGLSDDGRLKIKMLDDRIQQIASGDVTCLRKP